MIQNQDFDTWGHSALVSMVPIGTMHTVGSLSRILNKDSVRGQPLSHGGTTDSRHWHKDSIQQLPITSNQEFPIAEECFSHKDKKTRWLCS